MNCRRAVWDHLHFDRLKRQILTTSLFEKKKLLEVFDTVETIFELLREIEQRKKVIPQLLPRF